MAVAAFVAGAILLVMMHDRWELAVLSAGLMLGSGARPCRGSSNDWRDWQASSARRQTPSISSIIWACAESRRTWAEIALGWCLVGMSIWAALCAVGGEASHAVPAEIALSIAAGALSVVAGFASFIPGGLVVRDAVLLELLAPAVGKGPALVCALVTRLVWLLSEVGISIILYPVGKKPPDARPEP